jgi:hypothetical protein
MAQRTPHPKRVTYFPAQGSDGWRVEMLHGARIMRRLSVDTKEEAIEGAKKLLREWPEAIFELATIAHVFAWQDGGWFYSLKERPGAVRAKLLDEMGEEVLMVEDCGTLFVRGARCVD